MSYISARDASELWSISQRRVAILCSEGRIDGAHMMGNMWLIPQDAQKPDDARSVQFQPKSPAAAKPFLKWAGGKAQVLNNIRIKYPEGLGKTVTKYAEPFVGGGAVLFDVLDKYEMSEIYISDTNRELIHAYIAVRDDIDELITQLKNIEQSYLSSGEVERKEMYYISRKKFNALKLAECASSEIAALFIFLNRTCFNGLYRVNSKGEFNVPQGNYKKPRICDEDNLRAASEKLQNAHIACKDYRESVDFIDSKTFAYFDPPYRPLTQSSSFTSYTKDGFTDEDQVELARFIDELSEREALIVASNSDPKNTDETDDFFDKLYSRHKIFRIRASRAINSVSKNRGKVNELLIASY